MTMTQDEIAVDSFATISIEDHGLGYHYKRAGEGATLVAIAGDGDAGRFYALLAERFAVTLVETGRLEPNANNLAKMLSALGTDTAAMIVHGKRAAAALDCARASSEAMAKLILIAPELGQEQDFANVATPVLVLEGTADRTDGIGQRLAGSLAECYDILVYDATRALATERPEATASVVADFIERGGGFTVTKPQGPIYP